MKVIASWAVALLAVIAAGVLLVALVAPPSGTVTCDSASACAEIAAELTPKSPMLAPSAPGLTFTSGSVVLPTAPSMPPWVVWIDYKATGGRFLGLVARPWSHPFICRTALATRTLTIGLAPACYVVTDHAGLSGVHEGVLYVFTTPIPRSMGLGDVGPSPIRDWLIGVMSSLYGGGA